jgi:hypothetical protein
VSPRSRHLLGLAAALVTLAHAAWWWSFAIDDAYITFRYAANFAAGHGMAFNPGDRFEGLTNLGWAILLAPFSGGDLLYVAKAIGIVCTLGTVGLLTRWTAEAGLGAIGTGVALATFALTPWAPSHAMQGMETPAVMLAVTAGWTLARRERAGGLPWASLAMAAGPWLRPDAALIPMILAFSRPFDRRWARGAGLVAASAGLLVAVKLAWFGEVIPNTFYAKTSWPPTGGLAYLRHFLTVPSPVLSAALVASTALALVRPRLPAFVFAAWLAAVTLQDGDFMLNYRLLAPVWPAGCAVLGVGAEAALTRLPAFAVVAVAGVALAPAARVLRLDRLDAPVAPPAESKSGWVPDPGAGHARRAGFPVAWAVVRGGSDAVAFADIGVFGWLVDGPVIDLLGLTDRVMAGRDPAIKRWSYLRDRLGYLLVDPRSGSWGRLRGALAEDGWPLVDGCGGTWVFQNPHRPQAAPGPTELARRLALARRRAPREPWLHAAIARELAQAGQAEAVIEPWATSLSAAERCAIGLDGCTPGPIGCEDGVRVDVARFVSPSAWPEATGATEPIDAEPGQAEAGNLCARALAEAESAWLAASAAQGGEGAVKARRAARAVRAPLAVGGRHVEAAAEAGRGVPEVDAAVDATSAARAACAGR